VFSSKTSAQPVKKAKSFSKKAHQTRATPLNKRWIEPSTENISVQPGAEVTFPFTVTVPTEAEPGGHYASILFQLGGQPEAGVTSVQHRIGSLILLRVSGDVVEEGVIESFSGTIIVTNIFGKKVDEIPLSGSNVFPGSIRRMATTWEKENLIGNYTATLVATYGQQNLPLTAATKFTVISPVAAILLVAGTIAALIFIASLISGRGRVLKALRILTTGRS
jgi:hypothetical protein